MVQGNQRLLDIVEENNFTMIWIKGEWTDKERGVIKRKYVYDQRFYRSLTEFKLEYGAWMKDDKMLEKYYKHNEMLLSHEDLINHIKNLGSVLTIKKVV